jgi:hypothetical protein
MAAAAEASPTAAALTPIPVFSSDVSVSSPLLFRSRGALTTRPASYADTSSCSAVNSVVEAAEAVTRDSASSSSFLEKNDGHFQPLFFSFFFVVSLF